tara:strand:+ start:1041 stop:2444 length:1404 start_codon:yes stop_codon:yes gene_type:complete
MISNIYKTIHKKIINFWKFFFFLKNVFIIFVVAIILFLSIPKFLDYEKKHTIINEYLIKNYNLKIKNYNSIKYAILPFPNLSLKDVSFQIMDEPLIFDTQKVNIFLSIKNIYDFKNFKANKLLLKDNKITLDIDNSRKLLEYFYALKNKLIVKNLSIDLKKNDNSILNLKNVKYSNYGYKKDNIEGNIFDNTFRIKFDKNKKRLNFKIYEIGLKADFNFEEKNITQSLSGSSKINILNNYIKLNFIKKKDQIIIPKSYLRSENLSLYFDSLIKFDPFFEMNSNIFIKKIDSKLFNRFTIDKILKEKEIIKKLNNKNKIIYDNKISRKNLITGYMSEYNFAHGKLVFASKIDIHGGTVNCKGETVLTDEYPRLNFDCIFNLYDKRKILKKLSLSNKTENNLLNMNVAGSLNILNQKINFTKISANKTYIAKEEEKNYFKETFEKILFNESFFDIFKTSKIKEFLTEIL